jgi:hypothetical protein
VDLGETPVGFAPPLSHCRLALGTLSRAGEPQDAPEDRAAAGPEAYPSSPTPAASPTRAAAAPLSYPVKDQIVNPTTAKAPSSQIPQPLLVQANRVIVSGRWLAA